MTEERNAAIDRLRGLVMILMALDHARDFFGDFRRDPTDIATTTGALFTTRWVTHFCAPVFVLLAGTAAYLMEHRGKTKAEISKFLFTRGVWLVILELTIIRFGWFFDPKFRFVALQVIWAIGWSMIALAGLVRLPLRAVLAIGVTMVAGHNLLDRVTAESLHLPKWLWSMIHVQGPIYASGERRIFVIYPLVPWIGVMACGYALGPLVTRPVEERKKLLLRLGLAMIGAFIVIRLINRYGDPHPWHGWPTLAQTAMHFLACHKYPPSLCYLLMTLGPAMCGLALLEHANGPIGRFFTIFGKVPLFYYVVHIYLLHLLAGIVAYALFREAIFTKAFYEGGGVRLGLPGIYAGWALALAMLYLPSRWFGRLKDRRKDLRFLSYM